MGFTRQQYLQSAQKALMFFAINVALITYHKLNKGGAADGDAAAFEAAEPKRQRGRARIDHACEMRELFDSYCNLAGPFADAEDASHRGAAYLTYCDAFRRLQERCRADAI